MKMKNRQIIIGLERWQFVGDCHRDGDYVVIENCSNIRRWGTERGLGQLALEGPTAETVLDPYGVVRVHVLAIVGSIDCTEKAWK